MRNIILKRLILISCCLLIGINGVCAEKIPFFKKNDRVAVIGDSITHHGQYHLFVETFLLTRFPKSNILFFNKGIGSDTSWGTLERFDADILPDNPNVATIMLGMNDIYRAAYSKEKDGKKEWLRKRKEQLDKYKKSMSKLIKKLKKNKVKRIILLTPSIYDQTSTINSNNLYSNQGISKCRQIVLKLAKKEKLQVAEIFDVMMKVNAKAQKKDPQFTIVGKDRIHPQQKGHMVMAYAFMESLQFPSMVSKVGISTENKKIEKQLNCKIENLSFEKGKIEFDLLENALPFPRINVLQEGFDLIPFDKDLNQEVLQITGLPKGSYQLKIDGADMGNYNAADLLKGVNLALNEKTPMNKQALQVYKVLAERATEVAKYDRGYAYMKFITPIYMKNVPKKFDDKHVLTWLDKLTKDPGQSAYWVNTYKSVIEFINKKAAFESRWQSQLEEANKLAQPVKHHFTLEMQKNI